MLIFLLCQLSMIISWTSRNYQYCGCSGSWWSAISTVHVDNWKFFEVEYKEALLWHFLCWRIQMVFWSLTTTYTWCIISWTWFWPWLINLKYFLFCCIPWDRRVLIFPKGNNVDHLSMYLDVADSPTLPYGWSRYAQFSLSVINQIHNKFTARKGMFW